MAWKRGMSLLMLCSGVFGASLRAQQAQATAVSSTPVLLTLKRAVELALTNSKDIQMAKLQVQAMQDAAQITRSEFLPNLYAGSGAGYTYGLPETPGGRPPAIFSLTYTQDILNGPLRGLAKQLKDVKDTTLWHLLVELMEADTAKHIRILEFIKGHARRKYPY